MVPTASQIKVYEAVQASMASELAPNMLGWDFPTMLLELKKTVDRIAVAERGNANQERYSKKNPNPVRHFTRRYLLLPGNAYQRVRAWLKLESEMAPDEIRLVLKTLNEIGNADAWSPTAGKASAVGSKKEDGVRASTSKIHPNVMRKLVDHSISISNSLAGLIVEAGITKEDILDGDRMHIRSVIEKLCESFGIRVVFSDDKLSRSVPMTRGDLSGLGISTPLTRKRRR